MRPGHSLERRHFIEANGPPPPATNTTAIYSQPQLSSVNWTSGQKYRGTPSTAFDSHYDIFNSTPLLSFFFHFQFFGQLLNSIIKDFPSMINNQACLCLVHFLKREKLSEILNLHFTYYSLKTETFTIFILFYSRV